MVYLSFIEEQKEELQAQVRELNDKLDALDEIGCKVQEIVSDIQYELQGKVQDMAEEASAQLLEELDIEDNGYGEYVSELADLVVHELGF